MLNHGACLLTLEREETNNANNAAEAQKASGVDIHQLMAKEAGLNILGILFSDKNSTVRSIQE